MKLSGAALGVLVVALLPACPPPGKGGYGGGGRGGGGGGGALHSHAWGTINTSNVGRKLYAFLVASAELDRSSFELENSVRDACAKMARELGVSPEGDTRTVCMRAKQELDANLQVSVKTEKRLVTKYTP